MNLNQLRIGTRLGASFAIVLLLTLVVGLGSINRMGAVNAAAADLATNWLVATRALGETRAALNAQRRAEAMELMASDPQALATMERRLADAKERANLAWKRYTDTVTTDEERALVAEAESAWKRYADLQPKMLAPVARGCKPGRAGPHALCGRRTPGLRCLDAGTGPRSGVPVQGGRRRLCDVPGQLPTHGSGWWRRCWERPSAWAPRWPG